MHSLEQLKADESAASCFLSGLLAQRAAGIDAEFLHSLRFLDEN